MAWQRTVIIRGTWERSETTGADIYLVRKQLARTSRAYGMRVIFTAKREPLMRDGKLVRHGTFEAWMVAPPYENQEARRAHPAFMVGHKRPFTNAKQLLVMMLGNITCRPPKVFLDRDRCETRERYITATSIPAVAS